MSALDAAHGVSGRSRSYRQALSFHNLSLILERGRPTAKRAIAGSDRTNQEVAEAVALGYEANILKRVLKSQRPRPRLPHTKARGGTATRLAQNTDTVGADGAERRVEQGVDGMSEIPFVLEFLQ